MTAGISRPDVWFGFCANRDPNDVNTPSVWTALESSSLQVPSVTGLARGRDYELAQPMAADPVLLVRDPNEILNPDNPSSALAGLVKPYREIAAVCQWPITATGGNNNLINSGTWRGSNVDAFDPTFESYTTGAVAPNWLDRYAVSTVISTSNPFQGSKSVQYTIDTTGVEQGLAWGVPCIPGRQYTSSAYVRQSAANTVGIFLEGVTAVWDRWNRTVVDGTGVPNASWNAVGYTITPNVPADYDVVPGTLTITLSSANTLKYATTGSFYDSDQTIRIKVPALATGDIFWQGLVSRYVDASNQYRAALQFATDGSMVLLIRRRLAAVETVLATLTLPFAYAAGSEFNLNFRTSGGALTATVWLITQRESASYQVSAFDTSAALQASAAIGLFAWRNTGNTNTNLATGFGEYAASASVAGTSTVVSGSYQRLSITYTADGLGRPANVDDNQLGKRPQGLAVSVVTVGATAAATVNIDAIQHEQAAAVSAFAAAGPVIYPLFRNLAERYTRTWRAKGYEGVVAIPCVDALAALNKIFVSNPADQAVLNAQPDFFYTLNGGTDSASFPDSSGNAGPPLTRYTSKYGPGTDIEPGAALNLPGAPGATGVQFTQAGIAGFALSPGTALGTTAINWPPVTGSSWAMSFACWATLEDLVGTRLYALLAWTRDGAASGQILGLWFELDSTGVPGTNTIELDLIGPTAAGGLIAPVPDANSDGEAHHYAFSISISGSTADMSIWVDGVQSTTSHLITWPAGTAPLRYMTLGLDTAGLTGYEWNGVISKAAIWGRAITDTEVGTMVSSGAFGLDGETSGARTLRHIQDGPYNGPTRIRQQQTGQVQTGMGIPSFDPSIDLLTDALNTMQAEQGMVWAQPDGVIAFEGRQDRWLRLTSTNTFGESASTGELPYQDGIIFDPDPTYVFPVVTWARTGGETALGGLPADRVAASSASFPRQFDGSNDLFDDGTVQDIADWIFYSHRDANTRVAEVQIDPWTAQGTGYSMWAAALSLEVGQRVTAVRRAKAANGGAGLTMSVPCFIERVGMPEINFVAGQESWTIALQLSPIGSAAAGAPTVQPWILEDTTYGVLDSTTVLGF